MKRSTRTRLHPPAAPAACQSGFTLMESLISLLVLSIGLLGIALLYNTSLQAGRSAITKTQAVTLAGDMADRISANPAASVEYTLPAQDNGCIAMGTNCTFAQMAAHDLFVWQAQLGNVLPQGAGAVNYQAGTPDAFDITVTWSEPGLGAQAYRLMVER